jgi:hypothetical protein
MFAGPFGSYFLVHLAPLSLDASCSRFSAAQAMDQKETNNKSNLFLCERT